MPRFHVFFDADDRAILIEDDPAALDTAPYDRIVRRHEEPTLDADRASSTLRQFGGIMIYADRPPVLA